MIIRPLGGVIISLRESDNLPAAKWRWIFSPCSKIFEFYYNQKRESFDRTFSKVRGFLRRSLKSTSAEVETLPCASEWRCLADISEGVKSPRGGDFRSFTPRAPQSAQYPQKLYFISALYQYAQTPSLCHPERIILQTKEWQSAMLPYIREALTLSENPKQSFVFSKHCGESWSFRIESRLRLALC